MIWQITAFLLTIGVFTGIVMMITKKEDKDKVKGYVISGVFAVVFSLFLSIVYGNLFYIFIALSWGIQVYVTSELIKRMGR